MLCAKMFFLIVFVMIASAEDLQTRKIPNILILYGILVSLLFDVCLYPQSLQIILLKTMSLILIFFFGMFRLLGLGDIKLWMVITCFLGIIQSSLIICISAVLLILWQFITNRSTRGLIFLFVMQTIQRQKLKLIEQNGYAFAPYIAIVTTVFCILNMLGVSGV